MDAITALLSRRSVSPRHLTGPLPTPDQLARMIEAAASAPDHKRLRPYRFICIPEHRRADLADAFRLAKQEQDPASTEEELKRAADKAFRGPLLLAVVLRIERDHPRVSINDQMLAAGAGLGNLLLAAHAMGFAGCIRSGQSATSRRVREALGVGSAEDLGAFLMIGTPAIAPGPRSDDTTGLLSTW